MERTITCKQCGNTWNVPSAGIVDLRCAQCSGTFIQPSCDLKLKCKNPDKECGEIKIIKAGKIIYTNMCCPQNHLYRILGVGKAENETDLDKQIIESEIKDSVVETKEKVEKPKSKPKKEKPFAAKKRKRSK